MSMLRSIMRTSRSGSHSRALPVRAIPHERRPHAWLPVLSGSLLSTLCMARLATASDADTGAAAAAASDGGLEEIVVTAEKYNSTIQNTPISMSALSGEQLDAAGITSVEELAHEIPGLSMRSAGPGQTEYEARGLASSAGAAPTVGFYLDEVPLSPPSQAQIGKVVIDPDLYDVNRIELLRGPQGTLYGSGSMGGTIKVITNQPKLDTFEGSVQGTLSDTQGGSGNGGGSFMLNIPFGDVLALRVVGTDTYRSGWIDRDVLNPFPQDAPTTRGNVLTAPVQSVYTNVNTEDLYGERASLLFQPNADFSVLATALYQRMVMGGYDEFDDPPGPAYMAHYEAFDIPEPIADTVHVYSLKVTDNLGFADLTSATGYWQRHEHQTQDASESISDVAGLYPYVSVPYSEIDISRQFSQEVRLTSRGEDRFHWTGGLFYSDESSDWIEYGANPAFTDLSTPPSANPDGIVYSGDNLYRVRQYAAFADGSYKFTDTLKLETGLRWYRYESQLFTNSYGLFAQTLTPSPTGEYEASDHGFNPRVDLSYSPNGDLTTYISASKGFRPGGPNQQVAAFCNGGKTPPFSPDSVWDYEIGEKSKLFGNWLSVNSDIYYIKWTGVQQNLVLDCGYEYTANAGNGRSFGPELEINAKLSDNWSISGSASYTDAKITSPSALFANQLAGTIPSCPSVNNCTVPILNVPKEAASIALVYSTKVLQDYVLTARVSDSYVGQATDEAYTYVTLPSYSIANARIGLSDDRWSASLFVDNLTNKVAWDTANNTQFQFNIPQLVRISTNQPRTFGTEVNYRF
jgi:iron complex outermembrane recepter protein